MKPTRYYLEVGRTSPERTGDQLQRQSRAQFFEPVVEPIVGEEPHEAVGRANILELPKNTKQPRVLYDDVLSPPLSFTRLWMNYRDNTNPVLPQRFNMPPG